MKPVPGHSDYSVTKDGRVWSHIGKGRWLKPDLSNSGYLRVVLYKSNKRHKRSVHRLILETYVGLCPKDMGGCHNNGDRTDNRLENLRWATFVENEADKIKHGTDTRGERHSQAKLTDQKVSLIYNLYRSGADSQRELAAAFGITQRTIYRIVNKKGWRHLWATT